MSQPLVPNDADHNNGEYICDGIAGEVREDKDELPTMLEEVYKGLLMDDDIDE